MKGYTCPVCIEQKVAPDGMTFSAPDRHRGTPAHRLAVTRKTMAARGLVSAGGAAHLLARIEGMTVQAVTRESDPGRGDLVFGHYAPAWAVRVASALEYPPDVRRGFIEAHRKQTEMHAAILVIESMAGEAGLHSLIEAWLEETDPEAAEAWKRKRLHAALHLGEQP